MTIMHSRSSHGSNETSGSDAAPCAKFLPPPSPHSHFTLYLWSLSTLSIDGEESSCLGFRGQHHGPEPSSDHHLLPPQAEEAAIFCRQRGGGSPVQKIFSLAPHLPLGQLLCIPVYQQNYGGRNCQGVSTMGGGSEKVFAPPRLSQAPASRKRPLLAVEGMYVHSLGCCRLTA